MKTSIKTQLIEKANKNAKEDADLMAMGIVRTPMPMLPFNKWMIVSVFLENLISVNWILGY